MKKYLLFLSVLLSGILFSHEADAQWFVTGHADLSSQNDYSSDTLSSPDNKTRERSLHLDGGYYFNDRLALGAGFAMGHSETVTSFDPSHNSRENSAEAYLFLRYDFLHNDKIRLGAKTELGVLDRGYCTDYRVIVRPVLNYEFTDHWSATTSLGNVSYYYRDASDQASHNWVCAFFTSGLSLGVIYTF